MSSGTDQLCQSFPTGCHLARIFENVLYQGFGEKLDVANDFNPDKEHTNGIVTMPQILSFDTLKGLTVLLFVICPWILNSKEERL